MYKTINNKLIDTDKLTLDDFKMLFPNKKIDEYFEITGKEKPRKQTKIVESDVRE